MSANVLKNQSTGHVFNARRRGAIVKRALIEAQVEARRLLTEAAHAAQRTRDDAESNARELRAQAYRDGYEAALTKLNRHLLEAQTQRDQAFARAERELLQLSVAIAEKIINREIRRDDAALTDIIARAIEQTRHLKRGEEITLRVNPLDFAAAQKHPAALQAAAKCFKLELAPDRGVASGGCVIETERLTVDARLETQLRAIERALLESAGQDNDAAQQQ